MPKLDILKLMEELGREFIPIVVSFVDTRKEHDEKVIGLSIHFKTLNSKKGYFVDYTDSSSAIYIESNAEISLNKRLFAESNGEKIYSNEIHVNNLEKGDKGYLYIDDNDNLYFIKKEN